MKNTYSAVGLDQIQFWSKFGVVKTLLSRLPWMDLPTMACIDGTELFVLASRQNNKISNLLLEIQWMKSDIH